MTTQDHSLTPEYQPRGGLVFRVGQTGSHVLPPVTFVVGDGPCHCQTYLDAREARALAALLIEAADEVPCEECHGVGEIRINRSVRADPQEAEDVECHVCEGTGASKALAQVAERIG